MVTQISAQLVRWVSVPIIDVLENTAGVLDNHSISLLRSHLWRIIDRVIDDMPLIEFSPWPSIFVYFIFFIVLLVTVVLKKSDEVILVLHELINPWLFFGLCLFCDLVKLFERLLIGKSENSHFKMFELSL